MKKRFFVAGTDTDVGKTYVSTGLLSAAVRNGERAFGLKPIAAGAEQIDGALRNEDALAILAAGNVSLAYEQINPVVLEEAIAPHIAAAHEGKLITSSRLEGYIKGSMLNPHDFMLVEGAGGWRVPLNDRELLSDLAKSLKFPVILVVNMKLGCLNHALLTVESIIRDGLNIAGWVANRGLESMAFYNENLATLKHMINAPLLGELSWMPSDEAARSEFDAIYQLLSTKD
ncbi:dethiobiotin synthase [Marinomonas balearica]|uniref:ATP-dependent dethiobiotin synthetase BioD n=1 Tax=Marinomonas balearica TaxID=491947 RepID=A0A4R6M9T4_9GAMM|nr:dethiobiotin synthase [Marinomonas balearica]TDO98278.1 dethiobiotin synthetase [Marinomonas balearica]